MAEVCTCPSGDGSLRWPCPVHAAGGPAPTPATVCADCSLGKQAEQHEVWAHDRINALERELGEVRAALARVAEGSTPMTAVHCWHDNKAQDGDRWACPDCGVSGTTIRVRVLCRSCQADVTDVACWMDPERGVFECNACHERWAAEGAPQ